MADEVELASSSPFEDPFVESVDDIRGRMFDAVVDQYPDETSRPDTREGSLLWTALGATAIVAAEQYTKLNEVVELSFVQTSRDPFLDYRGAELGVYRLPATGSSGNARFMGEDGTTIPLGTTVSTATDDETEDTYVFSTTQSGTIKGLATPSAAPTAATAGGGNLTGDVVYKFVYVTYLNEFNSSRGYTGASAASTVLPVSANSVTVTVPALTPAWNPGNQALVIKEVRVYRSYRLPGVDTTFSEYKYVGRIQTNPELGGTVTDNLTDAAFLLVDDTQSGEGGLPDSNSTGMVDLNIVSQLTGAGTNGVAGAIQLLEVEIPGVEAVSNADPLTGGSDAESNDNFAARILEEARKSAGAGNVDDYVGWAKSISGIYGVKVVPEWQGPGTVRVVVSGNKNGPINDPAKVEEVRDYIAGDIAVVAPSTRPNSVSTVTVATTTEGVAAVNEVQSIAVDATAGQWRATFNAQTTGDLAFDITAAALQTALEALSSIGVGNVTVSGGPGNAGATNPYVVTFVGTLGGANQPQMTTSNGTTALSGGAATATVTTTTQGVAPVNEVKTVTIGNKPSGGTFTLSLDGQTTSGIAFNATAATVDSALEALSTIGAGNVSVTGGPGPDTPYTVTFVGGKAGTNVSQMTADATGLEGGSVSTGGTLPAGTYTYSYTHVNEGGGETTPSPLSPSITTTGSTSTINLTGITAGLDGTGPARVVKRRIYRNKLDPIDTTYRLVHEIADNETTTWSDTGVVVSSTTKEAPRGNSTSQYNGVAPIGAHVTVETIKSLAVEVDCTVWPASGYTLSAETNKQDLREKLHASLTAYFQTLLPGEEVKYVHVQNAIHDTEGVEDFTGLTLTIETLGTFPNGSIYNVEVPDVSTVAYNAIASTFTEGAVS